MHSLKKDNALNHGDSQRAAFDQCHWVGSNAIMTLDILNPNQVHVGWSLFTQTTSRAREAGTMLRDLEGLTSQLRDVCRLSEARWAIWLERLGNRWGLSVAYGLTKSRKNSAGLVFGGQGHPIRLK